MSPGGQRAELLSETLAELLSARDPDAMLRRLLPKVAERLGADGFFNFTLNEKGDALYLHFCEGVTEKVARGIQGLHFGQLRGGAERAEPIVAHGVQASREQHDAVAREAGIQSYVCHPLIVAGRVLGTLSFVSRRREAFHGEDLEFLRVISQYAAVALDRLWAARNLRKLAGEREQAEAQVRYQRDTLERIVQGAPLPEILLRLTGELEALVERDLSASIYLVDEAGCYGPPISARPAAEGRAERRAELEDLGGPAIKPGPRACWSTPIVTAEGRVLGAFAVRYKEPTEPTPQEARIVEIVTRMAAIAIERKQSEQALKDSQAKLQEHAQHLEQRVAERTASLREVVAQMEEFSYSVSHDLRSPLRAMQGYAKALMEDYSARLDEQGRHYLHRIINSSARMERLIQDILTYSRLSRREIYLQPVLLERLVADIVQQYPEMQAPNATIQWEPLLNVVGHEPSLSQAISNLLSNAVKFVPDNTVPQVKLWTEARDGMVRLWVQDNGIGVRAADQPRLFGMFERVHLDRKYAGTGIGLAIVRRAMDRMGGKAGMESDGVQGSKFWIELPGVEAPRP